MGVTTRTWTPRAAARPGLDARRILKYGAPLAWAVAIVVRAVDSDLSIARDELFLWIGLGLLAGSITQPRRFLVGIVLEWAPFAAILFAYDLLRGYADGLLFSAHLKFQLGGDEWLFGGQAPTVWLQSHLWHGPNQIRWYDYLSWGVYVTHFLATFVLAALLWLFAHHRFRRYVAMVSLLAIVGFATYALYPAIPPWMASEQGNLAPITRIVPFAWSHIHVFSFDTMFQTGSQYANDVAAMPSLHAAYSLLLSMYLWGMARRRWQQALLAAYPLAMAFALVYTGEHFFIDVLFGWLYAVAVYVAVNEVADLWGARSASSRARRGSAVPSPSGGTRPS
jgi:membrane-associated phospholipid phosphatase